MTEQEREREWLASVDPAWLLTMVCATLGPPNCPATRCPLSERKRRLFACAIQCEANRRRGAERPIGDEELTATQWRNHGLSTEFQIEAVDRQSGGPIAWLTSADNAFAAALLREIVGNPFRPATIAHDSWKDPASKVVADWGLERKTVLWQSCVTPAVLSVARAAYDLRDWDRLPVLADALEDAGCGEERCGKCHGSGKYTVQVRNAALSAANGYGAATTYTEWRGCRHCGGDHDRKGTGRVPNPILDHLRGPGPHVRGCWALDALLGLG